MSAQSILPLPQAHVPPSSGMIRATASCHQKLSQLWNLWQAIGDFCFAIQVFRGTRNDRSSVARSQRRPSFCNSQTTCGSGRLVTQEPLDALKHTWSFLMRQHHVSRVFYTCGSAPASWLWSRVLDTCFLLLYHSHEDENNGCVTILFEWQMVMTLSVHYIQLILRW